MSSAVQFRKGVLKKDCLKKAQEIASFFTAMKPLYLHHSLLLRKCSSSQLMQMNIFLPAVGSGSSVGAMLVFRVLIS